MIKVFCDIDECPESSTPAGKRRTISVKSHWCYRDRVVLVIGDQEFTLIGSDLKKAIDNCTNAH